MRKQPIKKTVVNFTDVKKTNNKKTKKPKASSSHRTNHKKQKYGTSQLEVDFAREFLDKLKLKYIYQYEAKDIGRFFDFAVTAYDNIPFIMENKDGIECIKQEKQNVPISFLVEVDGGFFHSDPRVIGEKKLNPMQKHNKFVDFLKDKWCDLHGIPLLRIWEYDIRKNPKKVFEEINKSIENGEKKKRIVENRKKPH